MSLVDSLAVMCAGTALGTAWVYSRDKEEQDRNPNFAALPSTIACGIFSGVFCGVSFYDQVDQKLSILAKSLISFAVSLPTSAAVNRVIGYRSFSWVADLSCYSAIFSTNLAVKENKSKMVSSLAALICSFARGVLEKMRNDQVDLLSLMIPAVIALGAHHTLTTRVANWTNLNIIAVECIIPPFFAWALSSRVCTLLGRQPIQPSSVRILTGLTVGSLVEYGLPYGQQDSK